MASRYTPRVKSRQQQPTTGRGIRQPTLQQVFAPSWYKPPKVPQAAKVSAGGVPSSAAAAPQYSISNLPPDASWDAAIALAARQRDEAIAQIAGERTRTLSDYGFNEGPNGALTFDPNNAFSKASVMKKTYDTNRRSTAQTMGAGGQLYSGSFQNAQDLISRNQLQSEDALQKNLTSFLARNTGQRTSTLTGFETASQAAWADRLARFRDNPLYDPATGQLKAPDPGPAPAPNPAGAPVTAQSAAQRYAAARKKNPRLTWGRY